MLIFRDVSAQRRVQRERASQLLAARVLASIIESSDDAIISKSLDGIIRSWNAAAERLFGYTAAQAVGRHISLIIPRDRIDEEDRIIASLKAGASHRSLRDGAREIGRPAPARLSHDLAHQRRRRPRDRRVEDRARRDRSAAVGAARASAAGRDGRSANAKFQAFFEQGALFAGIVDLDGTLLEANRLSWEACGFTKEQAIGKPFWEGPWWSPSAQLSEQIRAASAQAARGETFRAETPVFRRRRQRTHRGCDHPADPGQRTGASCFSRRPAIDITEPKKRSRPSARIWPRVCPRPTAEERIPRDAGARTAQPAGADQQRCAKRCASADARESRCARRRTMLERQVRQMSRLVDDLLDMSRITRGRIELRKEPLELAPLVEPCRRGRARSVSQHGSRTDRDHARRTDAVVEPTRRGSRR